MKLASTILAGLAGISEATIVCANSKELFEVTCSPTDGFDIKINDACRKSYFSQIDFANSFVWGDAAITKMDDHTTNTAASVVTGSTLTCAPKILGTGSVADSEGTNAFNLKVPFNTCGITATMQTDSNNNNYKYIEYALYWNSQTVDSTVTQLLYQIGQVKMVCRVDPYQEDAVVVKVTEDTSIADPTEQRIDIAADLELEISHLSFTEANKQEMVAMTGSPTAVTNTAGSTLGVAGLTYTALAANAPVALGDYMELKVKETGSNNVLSTYSVSMEKCWASVAPSAATIDSTNPAAIKWYQDTSTGIADEFVFWDDFCAKYPDWVGPNTNAAYLGETTDHAHSIHAVHFRQFGFLSQQATYAGTTGIMYFHCYVKVCPIADEATCSKFLLDGTTATACSASAMTAPARKRRQANESDLDSE